MLQKPAEICWHIAVLFKIGQQYWKHYTFRPIYISLCRQEEIHREPCGWNVSRDSVYPVKFFSLQRKVGHCGTLKQVSTNSLQLLST
jgi:hypothetical protein